MAEAETSTELEQAETEQPGTAPAAEAEDAPEEASVTEPEQEAAAEEPIEARADEGESKTDEAPEKSSTETPVVPELADQEPVAQEPVAEVAAAGSDQAPAQNPDAPDAAPQVAEIPLAEIPLAEPPLAEPVADEAPAVATADDPAPAPEQPGPTGREEIPLAAMQGFVEINGRLVAFFQGESQAALAFWKAALAVRSPGDLAQLQAAEMSRAVDAAIACWTDLARRMGRLPAFAAPRARAA